MKKQLQAALDLFGENGEYWTKGAYMTSTGKYCATGACVQINRYNAALNSLSFGGNLRTFIQKTNNIVNLTEYNDRHETTFADIKALFERAIAAAE